MSTACAAPRPAAVPLREVERELARQSKALQGPGERPVQLARMSNLVIYCDSAARAAEVEAQVPDVVAVHPARVLLLVAGVGPDDAGVTAEVLVRPCGDGHAPHACAEQVTLRAGEGSAHRLPFAVRALAIGDLPVNLWWASPHTPPLAGPLLYELSENAQQIIYDSRGWANPVVGVLATASWLEGVERPGGRWRVAADLNWRRLKYWRRLLTETLAPASAPGVAESVTEVLVEHGPQAVVQGWEMGAWLARHLGWRLHGGKARPGVEIAWIFSTPHGPRLLRVRQEQGPPEVRRVRLTCMLEGKPGAMEVVPEGSQWLAVRLEGVNAAPRTLTLPGHPAAELIGRQLCDRERDPAFHESMAVARAMAQAML
jgi:glucose-6-phosphate dehydrogenase assembly protein OpcA